MPMTNEDYARRFLVNNMRIAVDAGDCCADDTLSAFASLMIEERLRISREEDGRFGWWDKSVVTIDDLKDSLKRNLESGSMVDVITLAAMIFRIM